MSRRRRVESMSSSSSDSRRPPSSFVPTQTYSHVSTYRSLQMELQLYSPSVKLQQEHFDDRGPLAVFGDHDQVGGKVILDPSCNHTGRLSISIEGAFMYSPTYSEGEQVPESSRNAGKRKHVFFSSSTTISISPVSEPNSPRSAFRDAFIKRRPSVSSLNLGALPGERSFPFTFDLPRSCRTGEEMPPSFTGSSDMGPSSEAFDVTYKLKVIWEAQNAAENPSTLEVPILFYPDSDFQSIDATSQSPQSWLEMPLRSDRPIPFRCAVTLPTSVTFTRTSHIPYFVVFTTMPRSPNLAREIAADATISVSLLRQVTVTEQSSPPPTPPLTPSTSSDDSDTTRHKLLKRVARSQSRLNSAARAIKAFDDNTDFRDKPLPRLPTQTVFTESRTLQNSICIGFPKRPRQLVSDSRSHPSLDSHASLPDGLHKAKIALQKEMLPCIDWAGVSVKYYLDVSVLIGQDDLRARIPIRIL
ncbi:hypothetical protein BDZ94DRAFT_1201451 [Collybia nuda]|uniref:Arrestin-like N-terminal domain-containing protein n=1 Tax=Collybia nuda TaxID=64659 RepID=A0A9P5XYY7_9AGAR|nr:hypothetical protein BDZ94DRAFT_1201451 [Collybia nuda]